MDFAAVAQLFARTDRELWLITAATRSRRGGLIATFVSNASIVPDLRGLLIGVASSTTPGASSRRPAFSPRLIGEQHLDWVERFGLQSGRDADKLADLATRGRPAACRV